jgi:hypothetical protein
MRRSLPEFGIRLQRHTPVAPVPPAGRPGYRHPGAPATPALRGTRASE